MLAHPSTLAYPFVLAAAAVALPAPAAAQQIRVSDVAGLRDAIGSAAPGSTIMLAAGDYPGIEIRRAIDGPPVTISGPRSARLIQLKFTLPAKGWQVRGVTLLTSDPGAGLADGNAVTFTRAQQITLDAVLIHGVTPDKDAWNESSKGVMFTRAAGIVIANSEIRHVRLIAGLQDSRGIVIANNRFLDAREGVQVSNVQGLVIRNNLFQGWVPRFDRKEHPDMIQFWTRARPTGSSRAEISNNLLDAGEDRNVQGLFVRAEHFENNLSPQGFHRNFVIRNNVYFGSAKHGISLSDAQGVLVENNSILASPHAFVGNRPVSADGRSGNGWIPAILVLRSTRGIVRNNLTASISDTTVPGAVEQKNNQVYKPLSPRDAVNPNNSFAAPLLAGTHTPADFQLKASSEAKRKGRGADAAKVGPRNTPEPIAALAAQARQLADTVDDHTQSFAATPPSPESLN